MADPDPSKWRKKRDPNLPAPPNPNARTSTPKPNLLGNNPGVQNFDLSDDQFTSEGDDKTWPTTKTRIRDDEFLEMLTKAYNARPELVKQWSKSPFLFLPPSLSFLPRYSPMLWTILIHDGTQAANPSTSKANPPRATPCSNNPTSTSTDTPAANSSDPSLALWIMCMLS
jgi:hypothetical protein